MSGREVVKSVVDIEVLLYLSSYITMRVWKAHISRPALLQLQSLENKEIDFLHVVVGRAARLFSNRMLECESLPIYPPFVPITILISDYKLRARLI